MDVIETYEGLVKKRKACRICCNSNPGLIFNGSALPEQLACKPADPDVVSYWSQLSGNRSPEIVVIGQDFSDVSYFAENNGRDDTFNQTNMRLAELLRIAGIDVDWSRTKDDRGPVYLTNAILCLKRGKLDLQRRSMSAPIKSGWVRNCSNEFLRPLLALLRPKIVVAMGGHAWRAVWEVLGCPEDMNLSITKVVGKVQVHSPEFGFVAVPVVHCGPRGLQSRARELQNQDWREIGKLLRR
jgi:hypothetical protein